MDRRFAVADELAIDQREPFDPVVLALALQRLEGAQFVVVAGDDQLAAAFVRDLMLGAKRIQLAASLHAQPRLERALRVVEAGVDDAAVVRAGVQAGTRMALEHADRQSAPRNGTSGGQPGHTGADDGDLNGFHDGIKSYEVLGSWCAWVLGAAVLWCGGAAWSRCARWIEAPVTREPSTQAPKQ